MAEQHLMSLQPGTVIAGRYEVVKCLGAGSMGMVYLCRHKELTGHKVAVKVLFPEVAADKVSSARFRNEVFAAYGVSHPNVVRAYEYLRDGDLVAYTMEYVDGGDLGERLARPERLGIPETVRLLSEISAGVQAIHEAGIVHRDLKPENIFLTKDGAVKIADFGIARTGYGPRLTEHGGVVGTIDYVSPEYMVKSQVDWRSDIYAMGIVGYEMLTGELPFRGDSVYATMTKRLKSDPSPPSKLRPECPPELDRIILKAMAREVESRYQSSAEMFYDLQPLLSSEHRKSAGLYLKSGAFVPPPAQQLGVDPINQDDAKGTKTSSRSIKPGPQGPSGGFPRGSNAPTQQPGTMVIPAELDDRPTLPLHSGTGQSHDANDGTQTLVPSSAAVSPGISGVSDQHSLDPEVSRYVTDGAPSAQPTVVEPVRMERVMSRGGGNAFGQAKSAVPQHVQLSRGSIDEERLRKLAKIAGNDSRSMILEVLALAFAVLFGVVVAVAIVNILVSRGDGAEAPAKFGVQVGE